MSSQVRSFYFCYLKGKDEELNEEERKDAMFYMLKARNGEIKIQLSCWVCYGRFLPPV